MYYNKVTEEVKRNFLFQPGSYWIYEISDTSGVYVDSVVEDSITSYNLYDKNNSITYDRRFLSLSVYKNNLYSHSVGYTLEANVVRFSYKFSSFKDIFYFVVPDSAVKFIKINAVEFYNCYRCAGFTDTSVLQNNNGIVSGHSEAPNMAYKMKLLRSKILQ